MFAGSRSLTPSILKDKKVIFGNISRGDHIRIKPKRWNTTCYALDSYTASRTHRKAPRRAPSYNGILLSSVARRIEKANNRRTRDSPRLLITRLLSFAFALGAFSAASVSIASSPPAYVTKTVFTELSKVAGLSACTLRVDK